MEWALSGDEIGQTKTTRGSKPTIYILRREEKPEPSLRNLFAKDPLLSALVLPLPYVFTVQCKHSCIPSGSYFA